ncbi:hypothetical protein A5659_26120 [Mycobacterium sp. 1165196.3]|uniref:hypothetical protein n=1 Tax=unclassified Mycobacterium TaxID=2642494 RepID=UPI0007FBF375|nr:MULTISPECIES: hypothetical protein [unclassified Mycobacterium]OBJ10248.1 hypothetical protein A5624_16140 [Mycobacterium sp. 1482292.6]OBK31154.1 hypothetical protein A5659_26120 [Mycobacterium sp. 1165196.3]
MTTDTLGPAITRVFGIAATLAVLALYDAARVTTPETVPSWDSVHLADAAGSPGLTGGFATDDGDDQLQQQLQQSMQQAEQQNEQAQQQFNQDMQQQQTYENQFNNP